MLELSRCRRGLCSGTYLAKVEAWLESFARKKRGVVQTPALQAAETARDYAVANESAETEGARVFKLLTQPATSPSKAESKAPREGSILPLPARSCNYPLSAICVDE